LKIFDAAFSPYGARLRIWSHLKQIALPFEAPPGGSARAPEYKALVHTGKMPALLMDDGRQLSESQAILSYLETQHPDPTLLPADALRRAQMQSLMLQCDLYLGPSFFPLFAQIRNGADANNPPAALLQKAHDALLIIERSVDEGGPYLMGASASLADCAFAPTIWYLQALPKLFGLRVQLAAAPKLARFWAHVQGVAAFAVEFAAIDAGFRAFLRSMQIDPALLENH
jgi:glutathione S-transferase